MNSNRSLQSSSTGRQRLAPAERQQPLRQLGPAVAGALDILREALQIAAAA